MDPVEYALETSKQKALNIQDTWHVPASSAEFVETNGKNVLIYAADTVVVCQDGEILGKPRDLLEARRYLKKLSGSEHRIITGVSIIDEDGCMKQHHEETLIEFYDLSDDFIERYINTVEPYDKAGGYAIQSVSGMIMVKRIVGSLLNCIGIARSEGGL